VFEYDDTSNCVGDDCASAGKINYLFNHPDKPDRHGGYQEGPGEVISNSDDGSQPTIPLDPTVETGEIIDEHEFDVMFNVGNVTIEMNYGLINPLFWAHIIETTAGGMLTFQLGIAAVAFSSTSCVATGPACTLLVGMTITLVTVPLVVGGFALVGIAGYEVVHHVDHNINITITSEH
jgi:hypothetical protein